MKEQQVLELLTEVDTGDSGILYLEGYRRCSRLVLNGTVKPNHYYPLLLCLAQAMCSHKSRGEIWAAKKGLNLASYGAAFALRSTGGYSGPAKLFNKSPPCMVTTYQQNKDL